MRQGWPSHPARASLRTRSLAAAGIAAAVLLVAGCGGSSRTISATETLRSTSVVTSANPSLVVAEFHRRGQAFCQAWLRVPLNGAQQTSPKALAAAEHTDLAASARFYRQLEALNTPKSLAPYVRQYLALQHREDAVWRRVVARVETGVSFLNATAPDQTTINSGIGQGNALSTRLGLTDCEITVVKSQQGS
jgi:hypothetical protein